MGRKDRENSRKKKIVIEKTVRSIERGEERLAITIQPLMNESLMKSLWID